jgi:hypothetical protein
MALLHGIEGMAPILDRRRPTNLRAHSKMDGTVLVQEPKHVPGAFKWPPHRCRPLQSASIVSGADPNLICSNMTQISAQV